MSGRGWNGDNVSSLPGLELATSGTTLPLEPHSPTDPFATLEPPPSKSGDRRILFRSGGSCGGFWSSKVSEGLVGYYTG